MNKENADRGILKHLKRFKDICTRNVGLKLLALLFAVILWSYIASSNASFTRTKTLYNVPVAVNGLDTLNNAGYALSTDITEALSNVTAMVETPISGYTSLSSANLSIYVDLSSIRKEGTRNLTLRGSSSLGKIVKLYPDTIEINVEALDARTVPVNAEIENGLDNYWYSIGRTNPGTITVTGPSSLVQQVSFAQIRADVIDRTSSFSRAFPITLFDSKGQEIPAGNVSRSTTSASATLDVYPKKELLIATDTSNITVPEGYYVSDIAFEPDSVIVAGDSAILDELTTLPIEPLILTDATGVTKTAAHIKGLSGFKYISSEQVYATVTIRENETTRVMEGIPVAAVNVPDGCTAELSQSTVSLAVTGPKSVVVGLTESDLRVTVDLKGYLPGVYEIFAVPDAVDGLTITRTEEQKIAVEIIKAE